MRGTRPEDPAHPTTATILRRSRQLPPEGEQASASCLFSHLPSGDCHESSSQGGWED